MNEALTGSGSGRRWGSSPTRSAPPEGRQRTTACRAVSHLLSRFRHRRRASACAAAHVVGRPEATLFSIFQRTEHAANCGTTRSEKREAKAATGGPGSSRQRKRVVSLLLPGAQG